MGQATRTSAIIIAILGMLTSSCATVPTRESGAPPRHDRIVAIGDVHGNYSGLVSIMKEAMLIDNDNRWIGGNTLLVQTGDLLDRGADIRQVLDLIMSLQSQAEAAGGKVMVLLGNHEAMNIVGSRHYVNPEAYADFAGPQSEKKQFAAFDRWQAFFGASTGPDKEGPEARKEKWMSAHPPGFVEYIEAMGPDGHYGKWLRGLPTVFRYGGTVFLHAGISPGFSDLSRDGINDNIASEIEELDGIKSYLVKKGYAPQFFSMSETISLLDGILAADKNDGLPPSLHEALPRLNQINSRLYRFYDESPMMVDEGPLWFRGWAEWPDEQLTDYLPKWLSKNKAWRVVVSHTPQADGSIQSRLDRRIFLIDTGMLSEYYKGGRPSALEIKSDDVTAFYESGEREIFPPPGIDYGPAHVWTGPDGSPLPFETQEEIEAFLLTASPASSEMIFTGVNRPKKLMLEKDGHRVNAIFRYQSEVEGKSKVVGFHGTRYFRDSYQGEIAAYELNRLLGLHNLPPTVLRRVDGREGTLQLWAEVTMPDRKRAIEGLLPPESQPWNRQMWDMRVFDNLINNIDRNQTNILINNNWRLILIDHTLSFAQDHSLPHPEQVTRCSRGLWHALRDLDEKDVRERLTPYLTAAEIDALFVRRERLVQLIQGLLNRNGEENVLF